MQIPPRNFCRRMGVSLARLGRLLMQLAAQLFYRRRADRLVLVAAAVLLFRLVLVAAAVLLFRLVLLVVAAPATILHTNNYEVGWTAKRLLCLCASARGRDNKNTQRSAHC